MQQKKMTIRKFIPFISRLSKTGPTPNIKNRNDYADYAESRLIQSGDIEKQPGPTKAEENEINEPYTSNSKSANLTDTNQSHPTKKEDSKVDELTTHNNTKNQAKSSNIKLSTLKIKPFKVTGILLLTCVILLTAAICTYNAKRTEGMPETQTNIYANQEILDNGCNLLILANKKKHIKISTRRTYLIILLLLSGDIHQNPGPISELCRTCKQPENVITPSHPPIPSTSSPATSNHHSSLQTNLQSLTPSLPSSSITNPAHSKEPLCSQCNQNYPEETLVTCDSCKERCHIKCMQKNPNNSIALHQKSFEWICLNTCCKPNYHPGTYCTDYPTTNRYSIPSPKRYQKKRIKKVKNLKPAKRQKNQKRNKDNLWNELPKISAKDYEGKDYCRACHKHITKQRAISCDSCYQWTHLKCSDMSVKVYNSNKNAEFPWVCNTCREPEHREPITDLRKLKPEELPASNEEISISDKELLILHYNCRSIVNKGDELERTCIQLKPDVVCLTETWLDDSSPKTAFVPEGYKILRNDRSEEFKQKYGKTSGGGTSILFKKDLRIKYLKIGDNDQETQWIEIKTNQTFTIGLVYRAEYTDLLDDELDSSPLEALLNEASIKSNKIIVLGDFNCDVSAPQQCSKTLALEQIFGRLSMKQLITKPTRISTSNKATTIDHVWTNPALKLVNESGTVESLGGSDHVGQYIKVNQKREKPEPETIKFRSYRTYNKDNFNEDLKINLENSEFNDNINKEEVNKAMDTWIQVFSKTSQKHAPVVEKTKKNTTRLIPWSNKELDMKITERNNKLKLYRLYGNKKDLKAASNITNIITHLKRKLKKLHYKERIEKYESDPRNLWKILREVTQTTPDKTTTEPEFMNQSKANQFNKFFATVGTVIQKTLGTKDLVNLISTSTKGTFTFKEETEETIRALIDRIRTEVATGEDNITARLLKDAKFTIAESITKLVNLSYTKNTFPNSMKKAIITPIHKKNCTEDISNYRPISILSVVSKIFERSATNQLVTYLEDSGLLNPTQHAYRKGHSTKTCLMEIVEYIQKKRDERKTIGLASLDLSKAFDSISHSHLLDKLGKLGLNEDAINWCKSYLEDRKQKTKFRKYTSEEHLVTSGVPQGSILGPIMFICFTNDMANIFPDCKVLSYADDTQLITTGSNKREVKVKLEKLIKTAQTWYCRNSLKNNASKTEIIIIGENIKDKKIPAYIEVTDDGKSTKLTPSKYVKILGIYIDDELSWNHQIHEVRKKACNSIRNLHRVNQLIPLKHRILLYNSLVASHYNYCDTVWSGCGAMNERKLQTTQNFAARSILGRSKHTSATDALTTLKFLTLKEKRKIHEAVYTHKALNRKLPAEVTAHYNNLEPMENLKSSISHTLNIPKHATEQYKRGPLYRTVKTWNSIPAELRSEDITTQTFKKKYQTHVMECSKP